MAKPFTWSYSKLSLYEKCPAQYRFRYVMGLQTPKSPQASRGTEIHASIEDYILGKHGTEHLHESVQKYADMFAGIKAKKPYVEEKIAFNEGWDIVPWNEGWGRLVVDSYYVDKSGVIVQEWKSGKMYDDHAEQRKLYAALTLIKHAKADRVTVRTIYTDLGKVKKLEAEREDVPDIVDDFDRRVGFMAADDVCAPRPGWYCSFCGYSRVKGGPCKVG